MRVENYMYMTHTYMLSTVQCILSLQIQIRCKVIHSHKNTFATLIFQRKSCVYNYIIKVIIKDSYIVRVEIFEGD